MKIISQPVDIFFEAFSIRASTEYKEIGFVPTMGALHEGHASLFRLARKKCDILVCSIYVNPLQFGANEDLDKYPSTPEADLEICEREGVDIVFLPPRMLNLTRPNHSTTIHVSGLTERLCGQSRPGHFDGVTTIVAKLFGLVQPHTVVFGEKDFQQLAVIKKMVADLSMCIRVIGAPIVREPDGLAMSSRNTYLSPNDRARALSISHSLKVAQQQVWDGNLDVSTLTSTIRQMLTVDTIDYVEFVDSDTLLPVNTVTANTRLLIAAFVGGTRLIDNTAFTLEKPL